MTRPPSIVDGSNNNNNLERSSRFGRTISENKNTKNLHYTKKGVEISQKTIEPRTEMERALTRMNRVEGSDAQRKQHNVEGSRGDGIGVEGIVEEKVKGEEAKGTDSAVRGFETPCFTPSCLINVLHSGLIN